jgi:hypothetical protein
MLDRTYGFRRHFGWYLEREVKDAEFLIPARNCLGAA